MAFVKRVQIYETEKKEGREGKRGEYQSENFLEIIWSGPQFYCQGNWVTQLDSRPVQ